MATTYLDQSGEPMLASEYHEHKIKQYEERIANAGDDGDPKAAANLANHMRQLQSLAPKPKRKRNPKK